MLLITKSVSAVVSLPNGKSCGVMLQIKELLGDSVKIRNRDGVEQAINRLTDGGKEKLQVGQVQIC